jgi:hypothetical protein
MVTALPLVITDTGLALRTGLKRILARKLRARPQDIPLLIPALSPVPFRHPQHQSHLPFSIPIILVPSDEETQPGNTFTCPHLGLWFHAQPWKRVPCERFAPED